MSSGKQTKPLNVTERRSTIEEFLEYCAAEKDNRQNSGEPFAAESFDQGVEIALQKLTNLQKEGWT
ncbi:MAG: nodulation protein E [Gammaproteobacteria bacterium]|nr:nodulation protein E [Gammaproteobacteria bacterium]